MDLAVRRRKTFLFLVVGWCGFATAQTPPTAEDALSLSRLAALHAANQGSIVTWQGTAQWTSPADASPSEPSGRAELRFALDRRSQRQAYRWEWSAGLPDSSTGRGGERDESPAAPPRRQAGLLTAEWFLHSTLPTDASPNDTWQIDSRGRYQLSVDQHAFFPEWLLFCGDRPAAEVWAGLLPNPTELAGDAAPPEVRREGNLVHIKKTNPIIRDVATTWTFDTSQGAQLVRLEHRGPRQVSTWEYTYAPVEGVWIPTQLRFQSTTRDDSAVGSIDGPSTASATAAVVADSRASGPQSWQLQIHTDRLNRDDGGSELSPEFLGVASGDTLVDHRSGQRFVVGPPPTAAVSSSGVAQAPPTGSGPAWWRWWVVGGGLALVGCGVVGTWLQAIARGRPWAGRWPWGVALVGLASLALVAAAAWSRSQALRQVAVQEANRTQSGHRCVFRMLRRQGIPSAMDMVFEKLPPAREPNIEELVEFLRGAGLQPRPREIPFAERDQLRTPAILQVDSPPQYLFADRTPHGELIVFDLTAGRGLCNLPALESRWRTTALEIEPNPEFLFRPERQKRETPAIQFESLYQDQGPLPPVRTITYRFPFKNAGRAPLVVDRAYPDCSCLSVEIPQTNIPPGGAGEVLVVYDLRKRKSVGEFQFNITVESNDPVLPFTALTIAGNNDSRLAVAPDEFVFGTTPPGRSEQQEALLTFRADAAREGSVLTTACSLPGWQTQAIRVQQSEELAALALPELTPLPPLLNRWLIRVQPAAAAGPETATERVVRVTTNLAGYRELTLPVGGTPSSDPVVFPRQLVMATQPAGKATTANFWLAANTKPFRVVRVEGGGPSLHFEFDPAATASLQRIGVRYESGDAVAVPSAPLSCTATIEWAEGGETAATVLVSLADPLAAD